MPSPFHPLTHPVYVLSVKYLPSVYHKTPFVIFFRSLTSRLHCKRRAVFPVTLVFIIVKQLTPVTNLLQNFQNPLTFSFFV